MRTMPYSAARLCARAVAQIGRPAELLTASSASCHLLSHRVTLSPPIASGTAFTTARPYSTAVCRVGGRCCCRQCDRVSAAGTLFHTHARQLCSSSKSPCEHTDSDTLSQLEPLCHSDDESSHDSCHSDSDADVSVFKTPVSQLDPETLYAALGCVDDAKVRRSVDLILLEYNCLMLDSQLVPTYIREEDWEELLHRDTYRQRRIYIDYLAKNECSRKNKKIRKADEQKQRLEELARKEELEQLDDNPMKYSLSDNTLFLRIYHGHVKMWQTMRMWQAIAHGPKLVFDLGYEHCMNRREIKNMAKQMSLSFADNMMSLDPFCLHVCDLRSDTYMYECMKKFLPNIDDPTFPLYTHSCKYTEVFERRRLVYLTPHCPVDLQEFNEDDIYVIGGLVDLCGSTKHSMARAKRDNIRMARLPLKSYVAPGTGFRMTLTLNCVTQILLHLASGKSWSDALLTALPKRNLESPEVFAKRKQVDEERRKMFRLMNEGAWKARLKFEQDTAREVQ